MYRGIYYCNRLKAAGGLLGTEVAMSAFWSIVIASGGTLNHGSPLFIRESYIKSGCPLHISRIKISPILEIDQCPQT
jgi:hypothetical protein